MTRSILLVEDDASIATVITAALEAEGFAVERRETIAGRDAALGEGRFAALLTDVVLPDGDGIASLEPVRAAHPGLPLIVLSAQNTLDTAVRASDVGSFEYFPKPFDLDELVRAVRQAVGSAQDARAKPDAAGEALPLVGRSAPMQAVYRMITRVLRNDLTVLILGESGTGKELVAEAIHTLGNRRDGPFVAVNAAAIPSELIESELFGHEKGAFTGAVARHIGKFEQAVGGTLFLDEIGDMPMQAQTRLLRTLQSGRIRRVGGREEIAVDARIVAATNRDLVPMIASGGFREDLYYRLNVVPIALPPLRERREDIAALARHFLPQAAADGLPSRQLGASAVALLEQQPWRGNVRELRNVIFRVALMARENVVEADALAPLLTDEPALATPADFASALAGFLATSAPPEGELYDTALAAFERPLFEHALNRTGGNQLRAAKLLGINRNTLRKRLTELRIDFDRPAKDAFVLE